MTRILWLSAFAICIAGLTRTQASDVRYRLRVHVFTDDGVKIEESKFTYGSEIACDKAGEKEEARFARKKIIAPYYCQPIHIIAPREGTIT